MKKTLATLSAAALIAVGSLSLAACSDDASDTGASKPAASAPAKSGKKADAKPAETKKAEEKGSVAQQAALKAAQNYISVLPLSKKGLIKQLTSEVADGYEQADAEWAVAHLTDVDWNAQADKAAKNYMDTMPMSAASLTKQLEFEGFTSAQAAHGVKSVGL